MTDSRLRKKMKMQRDVVRNRLHFFFQCPTELFLQTQRIYYFEGLTQLQPQLRHTSFNFNYVTYTSTSTTSHILQLQPQVRHTYFNFNLKYVTHTSTSTSSTSPPHRYFNFNYVTHTSTSSTSLYRKLRQLYVSYKKKKKKRRK